MTIVDTAARPARSSTRIPWGSPALLLVVLFAVAALISGFSMLNGIDPFDEGLMLQAARRIGAGQMPYRDFLWAYGPAQPYLLAGLSKLFGASLLQWRIIRVLADAGISLTAYLLVRDRTSHPVALVVWLAVACEISEPRSADPFPMALLAVMLTVLVACDGPPSIDRAVIAGLLTAVAAAFRLDFALYGLAAGVVAFVASGVEQSPRRWSRAGAWEAIRAALPYAATAVALIVLIYLPFAVADGPANLYRSLIGNSLGTRADWTLPFPLHFHAPAGAGTAKTLKKALDFYVPLLALLALGVTLTSLAVEWLRERRPPPILAGLCVVAVGLAAYLLSRTDEFHVQPLFVIVAVGLALSIGPGRSPQDGPAALVRAMLPLALLVLLTAHGVANRVSALVHPPAAVALHVAVADGVQAPPAEARAIDRLVRIVDHLTGPDRPIYVLPRRSDLVRYDDPLIYVLTQRSNPTRQDFGLLTGASAQARIVATLARVRPRVVVRWTDPVSSSREPNLRGRSSGVHTLDRWVARHYRLDARLFHYEVLVARTEPPRRARS